MARIIALEFITLDGIIQGPGGPDEDTSGGFRYGGWTVPYFDEALGNVMGEQMREPFALLLGRHTFEIFAGYWPKHGDEWPGVNETTKYVVSNTLADPAWNNSSVIGGDGVIERLRAIKAGDGPDLHVYGSSGLLQTLLENDLVDELWLKVFPITLGQGKRLFGDGTAAAAFTLVGSTVSPSGVIVASYRRAGDVETGDVGV